MTTKVQDNKVELKEIDGKETSLTKKEEKNIYFEHQDINLLCGMHSLNNFLGQAKYNVDSMNEICYVLGSGKKVLNPHKHWIMEGDYDVNVLMYALQECGFTTKWHDKRQSFESEALKDIEGFLVNIEVRNDRWFKWSGLCCASGRHWLTIKKLNFDENKKENQQYFALLNSSKETYEIKSQEELLTHLNQIQKENAEIICIQKEANKNS